MPVVVPPSGCRVWRKLRSETVGSLQVHTTMTSPKTDSDLVLDGIQNEAKGEVVFNPNNEKYDLIYQSLNDLGEGRHPRIVNTGLEATLNGALDASSLTINLDPLSSSFDINPGDILDINGEWVVVSLLDVSSGWIVTVEERGAHGTAAAAHADASTVAVRKWNLPNNSIVLSGFTGGNGTGTVTIPTTVTCTGIANGIQVDFVWNGTAAEKELLAGFRVYYDTSPNVDKNDLFWFQGGSSTSIAVPSINFQGIVDTATRYLRVAAVLNNDAESELSSEVSCTPTSTTPGNPPSGGPPAPSVTLRQIGQTRVIAEAKIVTSGLITDVKHAQIEIYRGTNVDLVSATPADPQVGTDPADTDRPYSLEATISLTDNYWARARFQDNNNTDGAWAGDGPHSFDTSDETTDTTFPDASLFQFDQDADGRNEAGLFHIIIGIITLGGNQESWKDSAIQLRKYGDGSFTAAPSDRNATTPDNGFSSVITQRGGGIRGIWEFWLTAANRYEFTIAAKNKHGWSNWSAPLEVSFDSPAGLEPDNDVPTIKKFRVYTRKNPPTGGDPNLKGGMIRVDMLADEQNNNTTFSWGIQGIRAEAGGDPGNFPTMTNLYDQVDGTMAVTRGSNVVSVTGISLTANELDGKVLILGKLEGKNSNPFTGDILEARVIKSHTIGADPNITVEGPGLRNGTGSTGTRNMTNWSIVTAPIWSLVDYHDGGTFDATGRQMPWSHVFVPAGDGAGSVYLDGIKPGAYVFRLSFMNLFGNGAGGDANPYIYAQIGADGTYIEASASVIEVGPPTNIEVAHSGHGIVFQEDFDDFPDDWETILAENDANVNTNAPGLDRTGAKVLTADASINNGTFTIRYPQSIPIDPSKVYKYRARYRGITGASGTGALISLGLDMYDRNDNIIGSTHWFNASNVTVSMDNLWVERTGWFKGSAVTPASTNRTDPENPGTYIQGAVAFRPRISLGNALSAAPNDFKGIMELDYIVIEALDEESFDRTLGAIEDSAANFEIKIDKVISQSVKDLNILASKLTENAKGWGYDQIEFTIVDHNTFSWNAFTMHFADGTTTPINAGNSPNISSANFTYLIYEGTSTLGTTSDLQTAIEAEDKIILAVAIADSEGVGGDCRVYPVMGSPEINEVNLSPDSVRALQILAGEIEALVIAGEILRTAGSGARVQMDNADGIRAIDSSGNTRVKAPLSGDQLQFRANDITFGKISWLTTLDGGGLEVASLEIATDGGALWKSDAGWVFEPKQATAAARLSISATGDVSTIKGTTLATAGILRLGGDDLLEFHTATLTPKLRIRQNMISMLEYTSTPSSISAGNEMMFYFKADKIIFAYNDGGTVRYKYLDLTGTGVTWVHTTIAP